MEVKITNFQNKSIKEIFHCHPYSSSEKGRLKMLRLLEVIPRKSIDKYVGQDLKPIAIL